MTIEQELQTTLKNALADKLDSLGYTATVVAEKVHEGEASEQEEEEYPCIVIITSTPVPDGNKSAILNVPCWIRVMSYLPETKTKQEYAELSEAVFHMINQVDDYSSYEPTDASVSFDAITIEDGEEPGVTGRGLMLQTTNCTISACYGG